MKQRRNYFLIFSFLLLNSHNTVYAMEEPEPPLSPRTLAIIATHRRVQNLEEAVTLLQQSKEQDAQIARLKEEHMAEQLRKIQQELQMVRSSVGRPMQLVNTREHELFKPLDNKVNSMAFLRQAGVRGVLIAQAIASHIFIQERLQILIKKSTFSPRVKEILNLAEPQISAAASGCITWGTGQAIGRLSELPVQKIAQSTLQKIRYRMVSGIASIRTAIAGINETNKILRGGYACCTCYESEEESENQVPPFISRQFEPEDKRAELQIAGFAYSAIDLPLDD